MTSSRPKPCRRGELDELAGPGQHRAALRGTDHRDALGGAFSPDGTRMALFARLNYSNAARLVLINLITGTAMVAPNPQLALGAGIGWACWLPDNRRLLMGPASAGRGYVVDTKTVSARPLVVLHGHAQDPDYTTVLVPPPR